MCRHCLNLCSSKTLFDIIQKDPNTVRDMATRLEEKHFAESKGDYAKYKVSLQEKISLLRKKYVRVALFRYE